MKKQTEYLQKLFYDLWNDFGSVYLLVKHSDVSRIGKRGFTDEERKQGLVLVFNDRTNTELTWSVDGDLSCVLAFGTRKEDVFIHHDDLLGVFSPEAGVQFLLIGKAGEEKDAPQETGEEKNGPAPAEGGPKQVVSLGEFRKQKGKT